MVLTFATCKEAFAVREVVWHSQTVCVGLHVRQTTRDYTRLLDKRLVIMDERAQRLFVGSSVQKLLVCCVVLSTALVAGGILMLLFSLALCARPSILYER